MSAGPGALPRLAAGLDFGTSGARVCVVDRREHCVFEAAVAYARPREQGCGEWREALFELLASVPPRLRRKLRALSLCATSGSVLWADTRLRPRGPVLMYFERRDDALAAAVSSRGPSDALARLAWLWRELGPDALRDAYPMHQADWLLATLLGGVGPRGVTTDWHNALKTGGDPLRADWGALARAQEFAPRLPRIVAPGTRLGRIDPALAHLLALPRGLQLLAGSTDSNAAFLASAARDAGQALSTLGSTLALKLLSPRRVDSPRHGVYSHRFGSLWLVSGASNCGGAVLRRFFDDARLRELSERIDAGQDSPLDLYPLAAPGERFPDPDPTLQPRLQPRPADDVQYLHGLLQALAGIEAAGYRRLVELGAPAPAEMLSSGGGAANPAWTLLRRRALQLPVRRARHTQAAFGAARLALLGSRVFPS